MNPVKMTLPGFGGPSNIDFGFKQIPHLRVERFADDNGAFDMAAHCSMIHFRSGSFSARADGRGEINTWLPQRVGADEEELPLLSSVEVHHLSLTFADHGVFQFSGVLVAANLYPDEVYARIMAGERPEDIPELATDGCYNELPPVSTQLAHLIGQPVTFHVVSVKR